MFPLGRIIYMPLIRPISTDFSPTPTIPMYINNSFNLSTTSKCKFLSDHKKTTLSYP